VRIHVLVEGESEVSLLRSWLRRFLPQHTFKLIRHRGKGRLPADPQRSPVPRREGLLDQLPAKLRAYGHALDSATDRVLVLVDLDQDDCIELKRRLLKTWKSCRPRPEARFRIAIEETEAFYLGDPSAIKKAFPKAKLYKTRGYVQDSVCGTWELFAQVIGAESKDKTSWAAQMAPHLGTAWKGRQANASPSFRQFCIALRVLAGEIVD